MANNPLDISNPSTGDNSTTETEIKNDSGIPIPVSVSSNTPATATTATRSNVASSASSVAIAAANTSRKGLLITNDSTQVLYLAYGATAASATSYTVQLAPGAYWEMPSPLYTGAMTGIWASANGNARITELT